MMNSLWIAKTGMSAQQTQMDVVSHNLSNVSTTGYKRQSAVFEDLIYQNLRQVGAQADRAKPAAHRPAPGPGCAHRGHHAATSPQGSLQKSSNRPGRGHQRQRFLPGAPCPMAPSATPATAPSSVDAQGRLVTSGGLPVARRHHHSAQRHQLSISRSGAVRPRCRAGHSPSIWASWPLSRFVNPRRSGAHGREPVPRNARPRAAPEPAPLAPTSLGTVKQGFLESSNVNVVEELVQHDPDPARLRDELQGHLHQRPDAGQAVAAVIPL